MSRTGCEQLARELGVDLAEVLERWHERAAIREHDGGLARHDAEAAALGDVREMFELRALASEPRKGPRSSTAVTGDAARLTAEGTNGKS